MNKNRIKQLIKEYFNGKTECHTMSNPFLEPNNFQNLKPIFK